MLDEFVKQMLSRKMSRSEMDKLKPTAVKGDTVLDDNENLYIFDGKEFIKYDKSDPWKIEGDFKGNYRVTKLTDSEYDEYLPILKGE